MKKLSTSLWVIAIMLLSGGNAAGQITKGDWILAADAGLNWSLEYADNRLDGNGFTEGYNLAGARLAVGAFIGQSTNTYDEDFQGLIIAPGLRYYLSRPGAANAFFVQGNAGVLSELDLYGGISDFYGRLGFGLTRRLTAGLALEGLLSYRSLFGVSALPDHYISVEARLRGLVSSNALTSGNVFFNPRKGMLLLGETGIGIGRKNYLNNAAFSIHLRSRAAYFVSDRFAIGAGLLFDHEADLDYSSYSFIPFTRYYLTPDSRRFHFFLQAEAGVVGRLIIDNEFSVRENNLLMTMGGGVNYFLNPNVALEGTLKFETINSLKGVSSFCIAGDLGVQFFVGK